MKIILSTRNPSKAEQIKAVFAGSSIEVLSLDDAGIAGDVIEDGVTLGENAMKKARFAHEHATEYWTMADDTGIFITALDGRPGIYAARWAGEHATTAEITQHTLESLEGATDRSATFETMVALVSPEGKEFFFTGKCPGKILETEKVPPQPKMPYSGIFSPDGSDKVWAEMSTEEENEVSHRGIAFRQAKDFLEGQI